jgi:cyclopropane fatty-acyl-phospholipid synthase-like methyltransferase
MTVPLRTSAYDPYADEYAAYVATREQAGLEGDPFGILPPLLEQLGDVAGQDVLDAGCGEGYLSRILAARGARVTGVDLSPRLVELAGQKPASGPITYRAADLCARQPDLEGRFDAVASFFVLNDVEDHRGFAETLARALRPGGRAAGRGSGSTTRTTTSCGRGTARPTSRPVGPIRAACRQSGCRCSSTTARCRSTWTPSWTPACA